MGPWGRWFVKYRRRSATALWGWCVGVGARAVWVVVGCLFFPTWQRTPTKRGRGRPSPVASRISQAGTAEQNAASSGQQEQVPFTTGQQGQPVHARKGICPIGESWGSQALTVGYTNVLATQRRDGDPCRFPHRASSSLAEWLSDVNY